MRIRKNLPPGIVKATNHLLKILTSTLLLLLIDPSTIHAQSKSIDVNLKVNENIRSKVTGAKLLHSETGGNKLYATFTKGNISELYAIDKNGQRLNGKIVRGTTVMAEEKQGGANNTDNVCGVMICPKDYGGNIDKCTIYKIDCEKLPPPVKSQ